MKCNRTGNMFQTCEPATAMHDVHVEIAVLMC